MPKALSLLRTFFTLLTLTFYTVTSQAQAQAQAQAQEAQQKAPYNQAAILFLLNELNSPNRDIRIDATKSIVNFGGFSDPRLFELLSSRLSENYQSPTIKRRAEYDEMGWAAKALASSGDPSYIPLLEEVSENSRSRDLRRHANTALAEFPALQFWHEAFKAVPFHSTSYAPERVAAYKKIIQSNDDRAIVRASILINNYSVITDPDFYSTIVDKLKGYPNPEKIDLEKAESLGWLLRVLGTSGKHHYDEILTKYSQYKSSDEMVQHKIRKAAKRGLNSVDTYAEWNAVIHSNQQKSQARLPVIADAIHLWMTDNIEMQRHAIITVYNLGINDPEFEKLLQDHMKNNMGRRSHTKYTIDLLGWVCNYFGKFQSDANYNVLNDFYESIRIHNRKLQRVSSTALKRYE